MLKQPSDQETVNTGWVARFSLWAMTIRIQVYRSLQWATNVIKPEHKKTTRKHHSKKIHFQNVYFQCNQLSWELVGVWCSVAAQLCIERVHSCLQSSSTNCSFSFHIKDKVKPTGGASLLQDREHTITAPLHFFILWQVYKHKKVITTMKWSIVSSPYHP